MEAEIKRQLIIALGLHPIPMLPNKNNSLNVVKVQEGKEVRVGWLLSSEPPTPDLSPVPIPDACMCMYMYYVILSLTFLSDLRFSQSGGEVSLSESVRWGMNGRAPAEFQYFVGAERGSDFLQIPT